jgi:hypothetical protein
LGSDSFIVLEDADIDKKQQMAKVNERIIMVVLPQRFIAVGAIADEF